MGEERIGDFDTRVTMAVKGERGVTMLKIVAEAAAAHFTSKYRGQMRFGIRLPLLHSRIISYDIQRVEH